MRAKAAAAAEKRIAAAEKRAAAAEKRAASAEKKLLKAGGKRSSSSTSRSSSSTTTKSSKPSAKRPKSSGTKRPKSSGTKRPKSSSTKRPKPASSTPASTFMAPAASFNLFGCATPQPSKARKLPPAPRPAKRKKKSSSAKSPASRRSSSSGITSSSSGSTSRNSIRSSNARRNLAPAFASAAWRCGICNESSSFPLVAPCGHSYCAKCWKKHYEARRAQSPEYQRRCPECRAQVGSLVKNYAMVTGRSAQSERASRAADKVIDLYTTPLPAPGRGPIFSMVTSNMPGAQRDIVQVHTPFVPPHLAPERPPTDQFLIDFLHPNGRVFPHLVQQDAQYHASSGRPRRTTTPVRSSLFASSGDDSSSSADESSDSAYTSTEDDDDDDDDSDSLEDMHWPGHSLRSSTLFN